MQKKKLIIFIVLIAIILILMLANKPNKMNQEELSNAEYKTTIGETEYAIDNLIEVSPIPIISAGMIPIKKDGDNWIITTKEDPDWYDYGNGTPAYMMLNNGTYQSELLPDMTGKKLAKEHIGTSFDISEEMGSIYIWIPRFCVNSENENIKYIPEGVEIGGNWIIPDMFIYKLEDETKADFSLSGIWIDTDIKRDTPCLNKIIKMNEEKNIYGLMANTKPRKITEEDVTILKKYNTFFENFIGVDVPVIQQTTETIDTNHIVLQIINTNVVEPIKANIMYNEEDKRIEINVTYSKNGIKCIQNDYGDNMELVETDGIVYTDTGREVLVNGVYIFTVIDYKNNKKQLSIEMKTDSLFKVAYTDGVDNMDNATSYTKSIETVESEEQLLLDEIRANDTEKTYTRILNSSGGLTAIIQRERTGADEQLYVYEKYNKDQHYTLGFKEGEQSTEVVVLVPAASAYKSFGVNGDCFIFSSLHTLDRRGKYNVYATEYDSKW